MNEAERRVSADFLARQVQAIRADVQAELDKIKSTVTKGEKGDPGRDGIDGKDGAPGENGLHGESGSDGAKGEKGDPGEPGPAGRDGIDGKDGAPGARGIDGRDGVDGIAGKDGAPGIDGRDGAPGRDGVDGKHGEKGERGADGVDGKSITIADVQDFLEAAIARMELDMERRGMEAIQRAIDRIEKPRDGRDGRDGVDGKDGTDGVAGRDCIDLATLDIRVDDDFRTWHFAAKAGSQEVVVTKHVPMPMHQGVYRAGEKYERGDIVSFGGSAFIAKRDTTSKPETDDSWQLFIKRGRDGKDGQRGEKGEPGRDGKQVR
jgi:hypothetical protein